MVDAEKLEAATMQFVELSNDLRVSMLLEILRDGSGKISDIAKTHSVPVQEVARNFKRMTESGLVIKNSEGEYNLTRVGELACYNIPSFIFISNNKKYFKFHNFGYVPIKFVQRLGSFVDTKLLHGTPIVLDRWKSIYDNATKKINVISSELFDAEFVDMITEKLKESSDLKASYVMSTDTIMPKQRREDLIDKGLHRLISEKKIERKMLKKIRTILVANENEAMVMFPSIDGQSDMREAFYGNDPDFIEWYDDYFEDSWKKSESFSEKQIRYFDKQYPE